MTNQPFKSAALAYNDILLYLKHNASAASPKTLEEIHKACPGSKNFQQVKDAVKKYRAQGKLHTLREGRSLVVWYNHGPLAPVVIDKAPPKEPKVTAAKPTKVLPEIVVTDKEVTIISDKIKITVTL